jgi:hypothetical protein
VYRTLGSVNPYTFTFGLYPHTPIHVSVRGPPKSKMKPWATLVTICFVPFAQSFPTLPSSNVTSLTPKDLEQAFESVKLYRKVKRFIIDSSKPIDISGKHAFKAPGKGDQRGPCPGLNVLANHGYISHDGITSYAEVVTAINQGSYRGIIEFA